MLFQYQMLAQQMEQKIRSGEMQAGQRLNSLRQFSAQQRISLNTAKSCYELLEAQGLIYAVNKSGYFVAQFIHTSSLGLPEHPDFQPDVQEVSHLALQIAIQEEAMRCFSPVALFITHTFPAKVSPAAHLLSRVALLCQNPIPPSILLPAFSSMPVSTCPSTSTSSFLRFILKIP